MDAALDQDKIDLDLGPLSGLVRIQLTAKLIEAWADNLQAGLDALIQGIVSLGTAIIWLLTILMRRLGDLQRFSFSVNCGKLD
jgi:hypothetical protein